MATVTVPTKTKKSTTKKTQPKIDSTIKLLAILTHLSFITGTVFIIPAIVYFVAEDKYLQEQAKEVLNYQIAVAIIFLGFIFCTMLLTVITLGLFALIAAPLIFAFVIATFIFPIVAVIKLAENKNYQYPYIFRLLK